MCAQCRTAPGGLLPRVPLRSWTVRACPGERAVRDPATRPPPRPVRCGGVGSFQGLAPAASQERAIAGADTHTTRYARTCMPPATSVAVRPPAGLALPRCTSCAEPRRRRVRGSYMPEPGVDRVRAGPVTLARSVNPRTRSRRRSCAPSAGDSCAGRRVRGWVVAPRIVRAERAPRFLSKQAEARLHRSRRRFLHRAYTCFDVPCARVMNAAKAPHCFPLPHR